MKRIDLSSFPALLFVALLGFLFSASTVQAQVSPAAGCHWLSFDGTNDYVSVANNSTLNPGTNSFSVAGWFKAGNTPAANRILIAKRNMNDGPGNAGFALFLTAAGELRAIIEDGTDPLISVTTAATYQDNTWRHVAANFIRTSGNYQIILYVNGVQVASVGPLTMANSPNNLRPLTLGAALNGANVLQFPLGGELDDFALWRRALTLTEIGDLYNGTTTPDQLTNMLRAYWPFEEGSGTTTDDASLNNNIGTLTNGPSWQSKTIPSATLFSASPSTFCEGASTTISFGINNGSTYLWTAVPSDPGVMASFDNPTSQNPGSLTVTNVPAGPPITVDVSVSVTSADGCQITSNVITVTVRPNPETQPIIGVDEPCITSMETYTMLNNGSSYTWSITPSVAGNSVATMNNTATVTWGHAAPGTYTITSIETDANGCATTNTLSATTKPTPTVNVLPNQGPFCEGNTVPGVTVTGTPGASFSWEITGDNTGWGSSTGTGNVPSFTAVNSGPNVLVSTVTVIATLNGCDSQPVSYTVTVNPSPDLAANLTPVICFGESFDLQTLFSAVNLSDANNVDGIVSVHSGTPTTGANQIVFPNFIVTPTSNVTYHYRKQATASPGCFDELDVTLFVEGPITINSITFQNNQPSICEGSNTYIEVSATNAGSGTLAYQWQVNDGNGWVNVDISSPNYSLPAAQNGARLRILNTPLSFDGLEYRCLVSTAECPAVISPELNLTVTPLPNLVTVTETPVTCNGGSNGSLLFAIPLTANYEYFINPGSSFSGPATWLPASIPFTLEGGLAAGDYNLRLRDAATLCFIDQLITIAEPDPITFSVAVQDVNCNGDNTGTLTVSAMGGNASPYSYRINGGAPQSSNVFTGLTAGTYNVEVIDGFDPSCIAGPQSYNITEPTALEVALTVMDLSCFESADGMIEPVATGGVPPYVYNWSGPNGYSANFNDTLYVNNFDASLNGFTDNGGNFVDVDPILTNGSVLNEYWSQNSANDRAITFYKENNSDVVYWEVELTNTTGQVITDLSIQYDFEIPWISSNASSRTAQLSWRVVGSGSPVLSSIISNNNSAPINTWFTDVQMDAFNLALRNQLITLSGLNIAPGSMFTVRVSGVIGGMGNNFRDMNHGVDNLLITSGNFSYKISDLEAGDYLLTLADALGCTLDSTITVTQPVELTIDLEPAPHICIDDNVFTLPYSAVGGLTNRYRIQNNPAFAGMDAGDLDLTNTGFQVLGASPLTISLNSAPMAPGFYHMLITPRSTGPTCTGEPIPFTVYVPDPNSNPVAQELTICSGATAVFDVTTTELEVPSGLRWAYQIGAGPVSPVSFETFNANGEVQVSQMLINNTMAPVNVTFFFRAYTFGPDGIDDNGETMTDDCREDPGTSLVITVLPEPAGSATAAPIPASGVICSGSMAVIDVNTTIMAPTRYNWVSTNGGSGTSIEFTDNIEELLTNNSNVNQTVTYTITPYTFGPDGIDDGGTGDDCLGDDVTVVITVEPTPNATATVTTPEICSGDIALIDVNTDLQIANTRYRWRFRELPSGAWSSFTNNVMYSSDIQQMLTNTTGSLLTYEVEIRPYTFGPNGNNNNGGGDDCVGASVFVTVNVQPEPVLNPPAFVRVCSDSPLNYNLPGTDMNGVPIIGYDIVSKTVASGLVVVNAATVPATMVSANYLANDLYSNPTAGIRVVEYRVIPYSNQNCVGDTAVYTFRIAPEPKVSGSANPQAPEELIVCSGGDLDKALIGYLGNTPGSMSNPDVSFNVELFNPFNLQLVSSNTYPATCLPADGIENDVFLNFSNTSRFVFYTITPVTNCGNANLECQGEPVFIQVEVEPAPQAALSLNLNGNVSPIQSGNNFVACSESNFNITGTSNTNPSDPTHAIWAQVTISGDVQALGFAPGTVILHGPLGNLNLGTTSLINTTTNPVVINFSIIPYIETTPSIDPIANPQELDQGECAGQAINFIITINPEPDHDDETLAVCSDQPLGLGLEPTNNVSTNVMVNEFIEFNTPGMMSGWEVPDGVTEIRIEVWGADGGNSTAAGGQPGGSGAYLERANIMVSQGDIITAYPGAKGQNGTTGGGGGGSAATDHLGNLMVAAGGGGGAQALGGGGQGTSASNVGGDGGAGNGGGGAGGFTMAGNNGNGAQGGFGGAAGFNGAGGAGFSTGGNGGLGTGGGGGGSLLAGGGGGGHEGGNGGDGAFQLGGYGGGSFSDALPSQILAGNNGGGLGQNGRVRISWVRTLPPITYTITSIDNPAGLGDGDGIDRSVAPNNVGVADVNTGISNLIAGEQWINNTNDAQTVTYTIVPENDTQCGGEPFTVTVTVDPVPTATITTDAPMNMVCSGEGFEINVSTTITVPTVRYRWRRQLNGGSFTSWTNNVVFGPPIVQNFVNTSGTDDVYTYEIRPYTYGPNGINNNAGGDDCAGAIQTISITVKPGPVMPTPANPAAIVCSDAPIGSFVPGLSSNGLTIGSINLLNITADAGLTYTGTPALPTLPANGLSLNDLNAHSWNNVGSGGLFVTYRIQHLSADGCADDFVDYTVQIRAEPVLASGLGATICSGDATGVTLANDPGLGFQTIAGYDIISIDFDGAFLTPGMGNSVPGTSLPASAISMDTWTNSSDTGLPVTYLIAPRAAAPNGCVGDAVQVIVNVEPTPTASVDVTVGDDPTVTVTNANSPQAFEICSDATNFTLVASSTTIPSDPNHELWGRLRILGDVEIFDPMAMGTITLHGPIGNLAIASQPLINTSNAPKTITVRILPYIETTPNVGSPTYNAASECAGTEVVFTITVYPQPDFNDIEVERCNEVAFGENLDSLANNAGVGANVQVPVSVEFDYTGAVQQWTVPAGVTSVTITAVGADGGNSNTRSGGSGSTATRTQMVTPGETMYIVVGGAGTSGSVAGGGGGGTGVSYDVPSNVILVAGGGGGASPSTDGNGGGGNNTGATTGGLAGVSNGGGGGGGYTGNGGSAGGQGGMLGAGANGGSFVLAGGWGFGGGGGGFQQNTFGAGGGGGGHRGGNGAGQFASPPASIAQGGLSFRGPAPVGAITPGAAGAGQAANGTVTLSFLQTVPAISYTIVDLDVPAGLSDADGDVLGFGDNGDGTLLENEAWTNTTDAFQTVTYTLRPVAASPLSVDGCAGENFEVSMTVEPTPRMELGNVTTLSQYEAYELTICSGETLNVPLSSPTVPSGGINLLQYRLISVTLNGVTGPSLSTPSTLGNASQSVTLNQTWVNTGSGTGTVTYVLRPRIVASPNCPGGDVTFTVTVLPEPVLFVPIQTDVCSDAPLGSVFSGFPTMANVPFSGYEVTEVLVSPSLQVISGPTLGMDADVSSDQYRNLTTDNNHFVTYRVVFFSDGAGCASDTVNFNFSVVREARVAAPTPEAVCSDESLTTTLIGYYGPTVPMMHDPNVAFRITYSNPAGLSYTGSNNYDANNTITCVNDGALNNDSWTNTTGVAQEVTYTIVPVRACNSSFECDGEAVTFTATIEPEVTFDLTLTHSGVPAGPQTINVNNAPTSSPLALTICADSPFEASIAAAAVPSGNAVAMVRVFITDPDGLTGMAGTTNMPQADLEDFLSFPMGISNPGTMPSTIEFRMRPYFDTNGSGNYEAGIDCDLGAFGYDLTVESAVAAQVAVINNPAPANQVCDEESFTIRLRKTAASVPVASYLVWVEFGANLTQISANPVSTDPMNPTVFNMPGGLPNNQVTFDASFSNASTSNQTVTYHIVPVSATGCLGAEITQVVTIYGSIQANPDPLGVCLGTTGTINSNVTGGGGGFTYTWTYQGGTARQFRINNQLFGNNPVPGTPLNNQTANLSLNANIQTGGILITLPGTILMDLVVLDANGCTESFSFTFVIAESPSSGTTVPFVPTVCENGPIVDLFDLLTVGSYDLGGTWSQTGGPAEGVLDPVNGTFDPVGITGLSPKIFMFTYTVDNGFCAPVSTVVTLSVQPNPQAGTYVGTPAYVCVGTSTYNLFNLLVPGSFEAGGSWTQTFGPTAIPILPNGDAFVSIGAPGNYTFRYAFAPVGICDGSEVFVNLVIETEANAGMVNPLAINEFCTGQSVNLFTLITANQPGGVWSELTNSGGPLNPSTGVFNPSNVATGTYQFQYLIVGQAPCAGTDAVVVTVEIQETPSLALTLELDGVLSATIVAANSPVSRTICSGTEITLNATSPAMPMSGAEVWYAADIIDPGNMLNGLIPPYGPLNLFTNLMQTLTNNSGGPQNLFITLTPYIETDPNGPLPQLDPNECFGESVSLLITVQETPQGDDLSFVHCSGNPLAVNLNNQINNNVFSTFEWSATNNPAVSGESVTTQTSSAITDVLVNNSNLPQTVVYTVTPISNDGCEGEPFTVEVLLENAYFTYTVSLDGFTYDFADASFTGNAWSWNFGDGGVSSMQNPTHTFALPGTYNVCLEVTTDCGVLQYCEMIVVSGEVCDLINLNAGLNLISTDVDPANPAITSVFADLIATNNLIFIQGRNSAGAVVIFDPALPPFLNTLQQITPGEGYYVRVQSGATLEICGAPIDPAFKKDLNAGINIVAYVPQASTTPQDYFADLITTNNLVFARGYDLGFEIFDPALPPFLNTLTSIDNSFGYEMRLQFAVPGTNWLSDEDVASRDADADPLAQSLHYDVLAAISNLNEDAVGELVYLETETGLVLGTMEVLPGGYLMTTPVYGFDAGLDESIDLHPGDRIFFRYGTQRAETSVVYFGDKRIRLVEVNFNESPLSTGVIELKSDMFRVFPNPFASSFNLSYRLHSEARVSIRLVSVTGQLVDQLQAEILQPAGPYELRWNNTQYLSAGVYFVQVFVDGQPVANLPVVYQD